MAKYAKAITAVIGALAIIAVQIGPVLPDKYQAIATSIISLAIALGVYSVPNKGVSNAGPIERSNGNDQS